MYYSTPICLIRQKYAPNHCKLLIKAHLKRAVFLKVSEVFSQPESAHAGTALARRPGRRSAKRFFAPPRANPHQFTLTDPASAVGFAAGNPHYRPGKTK